MTSQSPELVLKKEGKQVIKEEINLQYHFYLLCFFLIYLSSFIIPTIIFMLYVWNSFVPYLLNVTDIFQIFTNLHSLLTLISFPGVFLACYLLHLLVVGITTKWIWGITEKMAPSKDGIIPRNIPSKILNFYHIRSFIIKYPKYVFTKGLFPWLTNWLYNYVGTNKIGKGTTLEEEVGADKYVEIGNNSYIGVNTIITSHVVEGIFGNVSYFKVKIGDNVTMGGMNGLGPGSVVKGDAKILPFATGGKHHIVKGNNYYHSIPLRRIFSKKIMKYLKLSKEDLRKNEIYHKMA